MQLKVLFAATASALALSTATEALTRDPLPRRTQFGVAVEPHPQGGLRVLAVSPGLSAAVAGVAAGDVLVSVNGAATNHPLELLRLAEQRRAGDRLILDIRRNGAGMRLQGEATERPREAFPNARVEYGAVELAGGRVRTLFAIPDGWSDGAVLYMLQGHPCSSVEALEPGDPSRDFIAGMLRRGVAVYRIEKSGVGDSLGGPRCESAGFDLELAGFEAGWADLTHARSIPADRIFLFGHSMGGVDAPLLAAARPEAPPRGVAVYGTVLRNFHDYLLDLLRLQSFLTTGADPVEANRQMERVRPILRALLLEDVEPAELLAREGEAARAALEALGWDAATGTMMGHAVAYWRDLTRTDLTAAWRDAHTTVLSLYGESDLTALNDEDAVTIAEIVNHYRPGTARYVEVERADHLMSTAPPRAEAIGDAAVNAPMLGEAPPRRLNAELPNLVGDWIAGAMAVPSVKARLSAREARLWFEDATDRLPRSSPEGRNGMAVVPADLDGDGDLDLIVPQEFSLNKLLLNDGVGGFSDVSSILPPLSPEEVRPPGPPAHDSEDAVAADFDGDGLIDIILVSEDDFPRLGRSPAHEYYRGVAGGGFERVHGCLPDTAANGVAATDVNGDGLADVLLVGEGQDRLLINDGRGCFRDETEMRLPVETLTGQDARFVDVDGDLDLDLVFGNEGGHALWINDGRGMFRDETAARLPEAGNVEARKIAAGDVDGDGDVDLYFAHVGWAGREPRDVLYLNDGAGHFTDVTGGRLPPEAETTLAAVFADLDGDGDLDLATVGETLRILENDGGGSFADVSDEVLPGRVAGPLVGLAAADLNGDGRTDLYGSMLSRAPGGSTARDWMLFGRREGR